MIYLAKDPSTGCAWRLQTQAPGSVDAVVVIDRGTGWHLWSRHRNRRLAVLEAKKVLRGSGARIPVAPHQLRILATVRVEG